MTRRTGLGKGLDALIPRDEDSLPQGNSALQVAVDQIISNPRQPRLQMDSHDLSELADSIRQYGVLQPLLVRRDPDSDQYILIAGERRLLASRLAGLTHVPVILRDASDQEQLELALIENIQRADLTPLETAQAYKQLADQFGLKIEEIAQRVGKNHSTITNTLQLLDLAQAVQDALRCGDISEGHARALHGLTSHKAQEAALKTVLEYHYNVRKTEELVRKMKGERPAPAPKAAPAPEVTALEERLRSRLGTRVTLHHTSQGGVLSIHYYSEEELNALVAQILNE